MVLAYAIVPASEALIDDVEGWLDAEEEGYQAALNGWYDSDCAGPQPVRGFRCNWDMTKDRWRSGIDRLDVLLVDSQAVGFLSGTDILEIKPDMRGMGYGRALAEFMLERLYSEGYSVAEIGIAPPSAKPFWASMGFTIVEERPDHGAGIYAYKLLTRRFELGSGQPVPYRIEFFSEDDRFRTPPRAFSAFAGEAQRLPDGSLQLPERVACLNPTDDQHVDYFVRIVADDREVVFDKVKREHVQEAGIRRDPGYVYFIDAIRLDIDPKNQH